jgi:hypothetical protein
MRVLYRLVLAVTRKCVNNAYKVYLPLDSTAAILVVTVTTIAVYMCIICVNNRSGGTRPLCVDATCQNLLRVYT